MKQKEAEITSLAEYLHKETLDSLVNQTPLTMSVQVARERRTRTRLKMIYKNKAGGSDAVTSPTLYYLDHDAAGKASEVDWKSIVQGLGL